MTEVPSKVKLPTALYSKCKNEDQKAQVRASFLAAYEYRQAVINALQTKMEASRKASLSGDAYESNNWAYKQADNVGYQRAIEEILKFL